MTGSSSGVNRLGTNGEIKFREVKILDDTEGRWGFSLESTVAVHAGIQDVKQFCLPRQSLLA